MPRIKVADSEDRFPRLEHATRTLMRLARRIQTLLNLCGSHEIHFPFSEIFKIIKLAF